MTGLALSKAFEESLSFHRLQTRTCIVDGNSHEAQAIDGTGAIHEARWYCRFLWWNILNILLLVARIFRGATNSDDDSFFDHKPRELQRVALSQF